MFEWDDDRVEQVYILWILMSIWSLLRSWKKSFQRSSCYDFRINDIFSILMHKNDHQTLIQIEVYDFEVSELRLQCFVFYWYCDFIFYWCCIIPCDFTCNMWVKILYWLNFITVFFFHYKCYVIHAVLHHSITHLHFIKKRTCFHNWHTILFLFVPCKCHCYPHSSSQRKDFPHPWQNRSTKSCVQRHVLRFSGETKGRRMATETFSQGRKRERIQHKRRLKDLERRN